MKGRIKAKKINPTPDKAKKSININVSTSAQFIDHIQEFLQSSLSPKTKFAM